MAQKPPDLDDAGQPVYARPPDIDAPDTGVSPWLVGAGVAGAGLAGLALKNPAMAKKAYEVALAARYPAMLSGFALPKSILGNIGAAGAASLERGTLAPLKQLLSPATVKDFVQAFKTPVVRGTSDELAEIGAKYADNPVAKWIAEKANVPGRFMGAGDFATRNALQRAGLTSAEAAEQTLQSPLPSQISKPLSGRLGQTAVPFQRTPWNQFIQMFKGSQEAPKTAATSFGVGMAEGAATEDPMTPGILSPLAGRHSGLNVLGAAVGRKLAGGPSPERVAFGLAPVSDQSLAQPILDLPEGGPVKPFLRPSILSMLRYFGLVGE